MTFGLHGIILTMSLTAGCVTTTLLDKVIEKYGNTQHGWHRADGTFVKNPVPATVASFENGRELYSAYCSVCHGEAGDGQGPYAKNLDPKPADLRKTVRDNVDHHLYLQISLGRDGMPIWKRELSDNDRWDVVNYVKNLAR
jgi:mono/diheme cytochrome c family protein